jgi:DNA-binding NarL/FixJ family response regulator
MKNKIVLVDDHLLIAKAMEQLINEFEGFTVMETFENGQLLLDWLQTKTTTERPDIILLDISMPVMNGFETAKNLLQQYPEIKVVALTVEVDDDSIIKMIKNGAIGYLKKNCSPIELEKALLEVIETGSFFPSWINNKLFLKASQQTETVHLTDREMEVLKYMTTEMSYKEIGEKLFLSGRTIETYRDNLFEKLNINSRIGLAIYAIKNKLVQL